MEMLTQVRKGMSMLVSAVRDLEKDPSEKCEQYGAVFQSSLKSQRYFTFLTEKHQGLTTPSENSLFGLIIPALIYEQTCLSNAKMASRQQVDLMDQYTRLGQYCYVYICLLLTTAEVCPVG